MIAWRRAPGAPLRRVPESDFPAPRDENLQLSQRVAATGPTTGPRRARSAPGSADLVPAPRHLFVPALEIACIASVGIVRIGDEVADLTLRARVLEAPTEGCEHLGCVIHRRSQCEYMLYLGHGCLAPCRPQDCTPGML